MSRRRCVLGCDDLGAYMHRFPHPTRRTEMFQDWMKTIKSKRLEGKDPMKIYKSYRLCDYHFNSLDKTTGHRLCANSVPSVYLEGVFKENINITEMEHNYAVPRVYVGKDILQDQSNQPHCSNAGNLPQQQEFIPDRRADMRRSSAHVLKMFKRSQMKIRRLQRQVMKSKHNLQNFKVRLANAEKLSHQMAFDEITKKMTLSAKVFTRMQCYQTHKKSKGRRFNLDEKVLSLALYKKSPKCYSLLSKFFTLPSAKTLKNLLSDIKVGPGINAIIFEKLKETVAELNVEDRLCSLIFDEMSLTPQILYNASTDELKGFAQGSLKIANHALVFMIKSIKGNYKQPVAYYFTQSLTKTELKNIISEVIKYVQSTGLKVLCTVCDQSTVNVSAVNSLMSDTKEKYLRAQKELKDDVFVINGQKIIPLYDVPHLIKGVRNNLLNKDLKYTDPEDNTEKIVKWEYYQMLYEADKSYGELRLLQKITEEHVNPEKIKKMRVKMATQIFSHSVAVATEHLTARGDLPNECRTLIPLTLILDNLFDSLNSNTFHIPNGKIYKGPIRRNSPHHKLWEKAIRILKSITFIMKKKEGNKVRFIETAVPSINNFMKTLKGVQSLWKILHNKYSFDCLFTRNLNQDPIENFFGSIRSLGVRNISPNCVAFESNFKTLLLNNFSSTHSVNANCEADFNNCLQTLHFFINEKEKIRNLHLEQGHDAVIDANVLIGNIDKNEGIDQAEYVCGWVLKKCLKNVVRSCRDCRNALTSEREGNSYIRAKEYCKNKKWLCYPSNNLFLCFREIQNITTTNLKTNLQQFNTRKNIELLSDILIDFPCDCLQHKEKVKEYFVRNAINILIYSWTRSINRILSGKISIDSNDDDPLKQTAQIYFNKHKNKKY